MRFRLLLLLASLVAPLGAQEVLFNHIPDPKTKTRVEAVALFNRPAPGGFLPVRLTVNNTSEQQGSITISTESSDASYSGQGSELTSSFNLTIPEKRTSVHDILVPCTTLLNYRYGGNMNVSVRMSGSFGAASGSLRTGYRDDQPAILLSEPLYTPNASALDSQMTSRGGRHYGGSETFAGKFDARSLPEDWRAYSGYDGIAMTDTDWGNATPGARTAILRWNRLGGELLIYTLSATSDLATLGVAPDGGKGLRSADRSFGRVSLVPATVSSGKVTLDPAETIELFHDKARMTSQNASIRSDFSGHWITKSEFGEQRYNYGLFIVILVGFGVLVGPVNLFVFAKSGRRHRLFITTPLIALGTSVLLIALIILIDGFGGRGMRTVLMEVRPDDGENSAYILQEQVSRTGVLLGGGFTLNEPAVITSVPLASGQWSRLTNVNEGGGMRYEEKFTDGKLEVEGDWFQSRSEQGHFVKAIVPTRGRIEARSESGAPSFLSTFDFEIEKLYYLDNSNGWWKAEKVVPGKGFTCTTASPEEVLAFANEASLKLAERSRRVLTIQKDVASLHNRPGHFIAVTESAPAIETLKGIDWTRTRTFITGPVFKP
ncbi:hypothetical protein OKA04_01140 [Luteolibacter flavescens]|uniref:Uncharacterized protein n=1 Tax=Luteolibacter flavescens TaxID=1859460 RepID=A0ABT3FIC7_9BACT|nr:hypothetical protein [Luteolibacter flavescens]MCW1883313.1 hypothetical protein [Luteolibacter flavescens]